MTLHKAVLVAEARQGSVHGSTEELWTRVLMGKHPDEGLEVLQSSGLLAETLPEVQAMVGFGGEGQGHKDLWGHTKLVVRQTKAHSALRWAALFHDTGKVSTLSRATGKVSFHKHEFVSARLLRRALTRVRLVDAPVIEEAHAVVRNLGLLEAYDSDWTDNAVRRLRKELGEHFDRVLMLARADITTQHVHKRQRHHERLHELATRAARIASRDAIVPPLPKGLGDALMSAFAIPPSKRLGDLRAALEGAVGEGRIEAHRDAVYYVEFLSGHRAEFGL
jgi:poly(A) polymerase